MIFMMLSSNQYWRLYIVFLSTFSSSKKRWFQRFRWTRLFSTVTCHTFPKWSIFKTFRHPRIIHFDNLHGFLSLPTTSERYTICYSFLTNKWVANRVTFVDKKVFGKVYSDHTIWFEIHNIKIMWIFMLKIWTLKNGIIAFSKPGSIF